MQKEIKTEITKEKLIAATEKLIDGCDDPFKVTSRQIAEESGMQAAMINYCFGSRERLIYEVFHRKYKEALHDKLIAEIVTAPISSAIACAIKVLPVPGAPVNTRLCVSNSSSMYS